MTNLSSDQQEQRLGVHFGALCEPLTKQLKGIVWHYQARSFQKAADHITWLKIGGFLSDKEAERARKRLLKAIQREAQKKAAAT